MILILNIMITYRLSQDMFIETSCEKCFHKLFIPKCFSYNLSYEIEILDNMESTMNFETIFIWLIGISTSRESEKSIIFIKDFFRKYLEPFSGESSCIHSFFSFEFNFKFSSKFISFYLVQSFKRVFKNIFSFDSEIDRSYVSSTGMFNNRKFISKNVFFIFKFNNIRGYFKNDSDGFFEEACESF